MSDVNHVDEALACLVAADADTSVGMPGMVGEYKSDLLAYAQVHATLALVEQQRVANQLALGVIVSAPDALAAIERVRELHYEEEHECAECSYEPMLDVGFRGVSVPWPCPTIQALEA